MMERQRETRVEWFQRYVSFLEVLNYRPPQKTETNEGKANYSFLN